MSSSRSLLVGIIKRHPDGFGFFIPEDSKHPDVYVPKHEMTGIMTNDRVQLRVRKERGDNRYRGENLQVLERRLKRVVGKVSFDRKGQILIRDEGRAWGADLLLKPAEASHLQPKEGEWVGAEILQYPEDDVFIGQVMQIIGSLEDPMTDIERVALTQHLPMHFSTDTEREAAKFSDEVTAKDLQNRKNLRNLQFVTIDGATAKDFDDAIYVETHHDHYRVFVAIADVSHYVKVGTSIDQEAYQRGTSVYFPNFVIPMLPEVLSNGLCSLNPHVARLALVCEMKVAFTGELQEFEFFEAAIESKARVTYGEAQEVIEGSTPKKLAHVEAAILRAADLAKALMSHRMKEGSLDLELPEVQVLVDPAGHPVDVVRSERLFSHRMIEEIMLVANIAAARFLSERNVPTLYRVHEPPNPDAIQMLEKFLRQFGSRVQLDAGMLQKRLTKALKEFAGKPEALVLNNLTLRSMAQAKYSHENVGHFGLAFSHYAHFTSPIRRYPDLIVHRCIKSQIVRNQRYDHPPEEDIATDGIMLSACEQRSVRAERQIISIKKARYMEKFIGEEFDGMISSVTRFGVFVTLRGIEIDGLIHIDNLSKGPQDRMMFDDERLRLVSRRSGFSLNIGDELKVRVAAADIETGQIDFELAEAVRKSAEGRRPSQGARGAREDAHSQTARGTSRSRPEPSRESGARASMGSRPGPAPAMKPTGRPPEPDVLDLDSMPVEEEAFIQTKEGKSKLITSFEPPPKQTFFNPAEHLEKLLKKRGPGSGQAAGSGSSWGRDRRSGHDRRRGSESRGESSSVGPSEARRGLSESGPRISFRSTGPESRKTDKRGPKKSSSQPRGLSGKVSHRGATTSSAGRSEGSARGGADAGRSGGGQSKSRGGGGSKRGSRR